jgi:hypothetical protein
LLADDDDRFWRIFEFFLGFFVEKTRIFVEVMAKSEEELLSSRHMAKTTWL